ncbi:MAG TPA: GNAT family N-acetyltransferase [Anaerolineae bacterium]|nr:GNAT family N-acetyltransferase [Anaerolineae bacterium]
MTWVDRPHLPGLQTLINTHLEMALPGWALPAEFIAERLDRYPEQFVLDPWVVERRTFFVVDGLQVNAAAHLLRYGDDPEVGADYRNIGDIAWLLFTPGAEEAGMELLAAAREQMRQWGVRLTSAWDFGLPVPLCSGLPDAWPHIRRLFAEGGFTTEAGKEFIFGGDLDTIPHPGPAPVADVMVQCAISGTEATFTLQHGAVTIGECGCVADLTQNGRLPAFAGWGKLEYLNVVEAWRNRGLGRWLVQYAVAWMRDAGCKRIAFSVVPDDDARGAGRFYRRFGWDVRLTLEKGWVDKT